MPDWLTIILLGIIEGITEFLPISSTGHLLLAQQWLDRQSDLFNVFIQGGAVLAVLAVFKERGRQLAFRWREPEVRDYLLKMGAAFGITAVGGLALKKAGFELPEEARPIAVALLVGGALFLALEHWLRDRVLSARITWAIAIAVGVGQLVAAVFPGASRSGTTILFAMALGLNRQMAVEFTFLLGVPTLLAAGGLEVVSALRKSAGFEEPVGLLLLGTLVSAVTAFLAVKWLLQFLQRYTFVAFGWYRIGLGILVLLFVK